MSSNPSVLIIDLNNFARYPTLSVGYIVAVLRKANYSVSVFSPLMVGVHGVTREPRPKFFSLAVAKFNHRLATSGSKSIRQWRERFAAPRRSGIKAHQQQLLAAAMAEIERTRPQVVLISTYLMYRDTCAAICAACRTLDIPVVIGGPYFAQQEVIDAWISLPGLSVLIAGEVELQLPDILKTLLSGGDPSEHSGVYVATSEGRSKGSIASPLRELDAVPFPDYSDFRWDAYPERIVPILTGRGCGWGACSFCSDVTSTAGRTYRSRSLDNVMTEIAEHHATHSVRLFAFTDLKLNSDLNVWRGLLKGMQSSAPGSRWIASVHVGREIDNGLTDEDLRAAAKSGCVRLTTGLETGSQRIADIMKKGTSIEATSRYLHAAIKAGISTRCTMIIGHPDETAADVRASAEFLAQHHNVIERVSINRLQIITGTVMHRLMQRKAERHVGLEIVGTNNVMAQVDHYSPILQDSSHREAVAQLLTEVHSINRKPLAQHAQVFEGVM